MASSTADLSAAHPPSGLPVLRSMLAFVSQHRLLAIWLLVPLPMLAVHFRTMWERPQHQYFPIVPVVVCLLLWTRLRPAEEDEFKKRRWFPHLVLAASLLALTFGTWVVFNPWLAAVAFVLAAGAALMVVAERYQVQNLFGIWVLLWLLVPLPGDYEQYISQALQRSTTVVSGAALDRIGLPNLVEGTTLVIPGRHLFIEEACTGIVSMVSVIACCLILAVWANRAWLHTILLVLAGLVLVSATNILRIVILATADVWMDLDLMTGWKHDLLGLCLFGAAILLALSTDRVLCFLLAPIIRSQEDYVEEGSWWTRAFNAIASYGAPAQRQPLDRHVMHHLVTTTLQEGGVDRAERRIDAVEDHRPIGGEVVWRRSFVVWAILFALLGATSTYVIAAKLKSRTRLAEPEFAKTLTAASLPAEIADWQQVGFDQAHRTNLFAQNSKVWSYRQGDLAAAFSIDFSFDDWHGLHGCYNLIGWEPIAPPSLQEAKRAGEAVYLMAAFRKGDQHGLLTYSLMDAEGKPFDPPEAVSVSENIWRRLENESYTLYQTQLWVTSTRPIGGEDHESAKRLFESLRERLLMEMRGQSQ